MAVLKLLIIFEQGILHFHFALSPANFVAIPNAKSVGFFLKDKSFPIKDLKGGEHDQTWDS